MGHCHSVMHDYETKQIFEFSGGGNLGWGWKIAGPPTLCMKPCKSVHVPCILFCKLFICHFFRFNKCNSLRVAHLNIKLGTLM